MRDKAAPEILPCPFCDSNPSLRVSFGYLVLSCINNACTMKPCTWLHMQTTNLTRLVKFWNKRPAKAS